MVFDLKSYLSTIIVGVKFFLHILLLQILVFKNIIKKEFNPLLTLVSYNRSFVQQGHLPCRHKTS